MITHMPLVDVRKRKMRLYDVISVVCLLIAAVTLAYVFGGAWLYRPQKVTDEFHKLFYNSANDTWGIAGSECRLKRAHSIFG